MGTFQRDFQDALWACVQIKQDGHTTKQNGAGFPGHSAPGITDLEVMVDEARAMRLQHVEQLVVLHTCHLEHLGGPVAQVALVQGLQERPAANE